MVQLTRFENMLINKTRMTDHVSCATRFGYIFSAICLEGIHTLAHLQYHGSEKSRSKTHLASP